VALDLITCYNIVHGRVTVPFDLFFEFIVLIVALANIHLNYFILILEWTPALIVFLIELFHFGIVCLLPLYRLKH